MSFVISVNDVANEKWHIELQILDMHFSIERFCKSPEQLILFRHQTLGMLPPPTW